MYDSASLLAALRAVFGGSGLISKGLGKTDGGRVSQPSQTLDRPRLRSLEGSVSPYIPFER